MGDSGSNPGMATGVVLPRTLSDDYPGLYAVAEVLNVGVCQRG
jgi:hypothetical protein